MAQFFKASCLLFNGFHQQLSASCHAKQNIRHGYRWANMSDFSPSALMRLDMSHRPTFITQQGICFSHTLEALLCSENPRNGTNLSYLLRLCGRPPGSKSPKQIWYIYNPSSLTKITRFDEMLFRKLSSFLASASGESEVSGCSSRTACR